MALNFPTVPKINSYGPANVIVLDMGANATDAPFTIFSYAETRIFQVRDDNAIHFTNGWFGADVESIVEV